VPAPSISIDAVIAATPNVPAGSSVLPLRTIRFTCTTGSSCCSTSHTGRPLASWRFCTVGSVSAGAGPDTGGFERSGACAAAGAARHATTASDDRAEARIEMRRTRRGSAAVQLIVPAPARA
jgi:hypothetical protein